MVSSGTEAASTTPRAAGPACSAALPFRLVVVTDWALGPDVLFARLERALAAGPGIAVQHRHPARGTRAFFDEGEALAALCARFGAPLFVNGRLDVALALGAHLHLPARGLRAAEVRRALPRDRWLSVAVHTHDEARAAQGADLVLVSPVYPPGSKPFDTRPPLGPDGYGRLAAALPCPAFALGGMTPATLFPELVGIATIGAVLTAADPRAAAAALLAALGSPAPQTLPSTSPAGLLDEAAERVVARRLERPA